MAPHEAEAVAVVPAAVLPSGVRYSTLSKETHQQHHLAVGMDGDKYLAVHPIYSLSHRMYGSRMLGAVLLALLEVVGFLLVLLGLITPCYTIDSATFVALMGGYEGTFSESPARSTSLIVCSIVLIIFLFFCSLACPVLVACCVRRDQHARVCEESFNRELLEEYGAQVHEDGRVYGPGGEPSVVKEESMPGPCCGFEANERSRLSRNAWIACVQFVVEVTSVVLQSIIVYCLSWVYMKAVANRAEAKYESGFYITIVALVLRALQVLLYGYMAMSVLCVRPHGRTPPCQLLPLSGASRAGALALAGGSGSGSGGRGGGASKGEPYACGAGEEEEEEEGPAKPRRRAPGKADLHERELQPVMPRGPFDMDA
ncbi:hypothetical protein NESM_000527000 [Novymonas esmeraldas]|uniref:Uncharacterized protein n=1 Tax=Novymonas esmeraldas TaxID=1808958 RepID=A0AAW0EQD8_9TRYP